MKLRLFSVAVLLGAGALSGASYADDKAPAAGDSALPYTVVCEGNQGCKVDKETFVGWRTYHAFCYQCHAQDAVGSTFAPSLIERLKEIDKERFVHSVTNGYTGQIGVMPAWKDNPNVMPKLDHLYAYLKARSDGALGAGRPGRLPNIKAESAR